jgi:hypothetical protein
MTNDIGKAKRGGLQTYRELGFDRGQGHGPRIPQRAWLRRRHC